MIEKIYPPGAPLPKPLHPRGAAGDFIFLAGQVAPDPGYQARNAPVLSNMKLVLEGAGASLADVPRSAYICSTGRFRGDDEVYTEFFGMLKPARTTIVCSFMSNIRIEVDCVAYKPAPAEARRQAESLAH